MPWTAFEVVFRIKSPIHIGRSRVGNMLRTRHYLPARVLWGSLVMRITRDNLGKKASATETRFYDETAGRLEKAVSLTYFYTATADSSGAYQIFYPWERSFTNRFIGSYTATALDYTAFSAEDGSLREVEFIAPYTIDDASPVYLFGYIFAKSEAPDWQNTLNRLQLGGERCYGWGRVEKTSVKELKEREIFNGAAEFNGENEQSPLIRIDAGQNDEKVLLAHAKAKGLRADGSVEPFVGRQWRSDDPLNPFSGQYVDFSDICFQPGSRVRERMVFEIGPMGIWKHISEI